jgi:hypothetical protein
LKKRMSKAFVMLAVTAALALPAAPAQASTCHISQPDADRIFCDTVWAPVARTLCNLKICFG